MSCFIAQIYLYGQSMEGGGGQLAALIHSRLAYKQPRSDSVPIEELCATSFSDSYLCLYTFAKEKVY